MFFIFVTNDTLFFGDLPIYCEVRITQQKTTFRLRVVEVVAFIGEDSRLTQDGETMRKATRDEELTMVLRT